MYVCTKQSRDPDKYTVIQHINFFNFYVLNVRDGVWVQVQIK